MSIARFSVNGQRRLAFAPGVFFDSIFAGASLIASGYFLFAVPGIKRNERIASRERVRMKLLARKAEFAASLRRAMDRNRP